YSVKSRTLRLLLLSCTRPDGTLTGADRDWINLANAFDPGEVRIVWVGVGAGSELRRLVRPDVVEEFIEADYPLFDYVIQENAYRPRSAWLWTKIVGDHLVRLRGPVGRLGRRLRGGGFDVIVSNTCAVTAGAVLARMMGLPHVWCVKECL